ncbi:MAG: hypothetical protein WAT17_01900 [Candidatus Saccharimonadales bacterium]
MKVEVKSTEEKVVNGAKTPVFKNRKRRRTLRIKLPRITRRTLSILAIVALAVGAVAWAYTTSPKGQSIDTSTYQVVYLTNGQAYFGKLENTSGEYLVIRSPYSAQSVQSEQKAGEVTTPTTTLLRVRDQVYGPEDSIAIRTETVAFWQNLRDDSKITALLKSKQ